VSLLTCQLDATRRRGTFDVLSCTPRDDGLFDLLLADCVLYPEGGGQPGDRGTVAGVAVLDTQPVAGGVRLLAEGPVEPGPHEVVVDWDRRFDHMQQHSAQHLLSALAQDHLGLATVGFHLGDDATTIDLDGPLSSAKRDRLAAMANDAIRHARPVQAHAVSVEEYQAMELRSRGLPEGHEGLVRLVSIEGVDVNTCGGTHVSHLGELQLVHIARVERYKGGSRLHFLAGGRALRALNAARDRDRALSDRLTCPPDDFVASVDRLLDSARATAREQKRLLGELAGLLAAELARGEGVQHLHRTDADMALLQQVGQQALALRPDARLVLTGGAQAGVFLVLGPADWVAAAGPALASAVGGRGGGRGGRYQGKASDLSAAAAAVAALPSI